MNWKIRGIASGGDITTLTTYVDTNFALKTDLNNKLIKVNGAQGLGAGTYKLGTSASDKFSQVWSTNFKGDATSAFYADLAEKYTVNPEVALPVGTVMEISAGDFDAELCDTELSDFVIGVVSEKPGFIMNESLENSATIGLTGTLPMRVVGPVCKQDILVSAGNGCLRAVVNDNEKAFKVAVSFENNDEVGEKLVKCFAK